MRVNRRTTDRESWKRGSASAWAVALSNLGMSKMRAQEREMIRVFGVGGGGERGVENGGKGAKGMGDGERG